MTLQVLLRRARCLPQLAACFAVVLVLGPAILSTWQDSLRRGERSQRALADGQILASSIDEDLAYGNTVGIQKRVQAWSRDPELQMLWVLRADGKSVAGFARTGASTSTKVRLSLFARRGEGEAAVPIVFRSHDVGTVYLRVVTPPAWRRFAEYIPIVLLAFTGAVLVSLLALAQLWLVRANTALLREKQERGRAEQALRRSQKLDAVSQLATTAAHDFNNLLVVVQTYLNRIKRTLLANPAEAESYVEGATGALLRASSLSQRLLALARLQAVNPEPVDLSQLVRGLLDFARRLTDDKIRINSSLESTWLTECDGAEMENVILNLVINARDAMPEGGELTIMTRDIPSKTGSGVDHVELGIADTGVGMTPDVVKRATEPFFTTKPAGKGTGLGLSAARGYVHQASGELSIESVPGHGTTVSIALPRIQVSAQKTERAA